MSARVRRKRDVPVLVAIDGNIEGGGNGPRGRDAPLSSSLSTPLAFMLIRSRTATGLRLFFHVVRGLCAGFFIFCFSPLFFIFVSSC